VAARSEVVGLRPIAVGMDDESAACGHVDCAIRKSLVRRGTVTEECIAAHASVGQVTGNPRIDDVHDTADGR
jgi:hypothetical protein